VSDLKVTAKTSSFYFKGKDVTIAEVAEKLHVAHVLEGSVQKIGNQVRVIAQLINAGDGTHLWSKSYGRDLEDIFAVQDEIAQEIVRSLEITLLDTEEERLLQRYRPTLEAYEQLILGRHEMAKRTADSLTAAEQHFKQAIELDPGYALAYVGLADTYDLQQGYGSLVFEESLQRRQPLIERALELDPFSGEAFTARASLRSDQQIKTPEEDFKGTEEDILKALELSPNYATAHRWYSGLLNGQGRLEEALVQTRLAAELDPLSPIIQVEIAQAVWNTGRAEEALTLVRRNVERTPEFPNNYNLMAVFQSTLGHLGETQRWHQEARRRNPGNSFTWRDECFSFLHLGDLISAEDCIRQLIEAHPEKLSSHVVLLPLQWYRGEWDAAIAILESLSDRAPGWRDFSRVLPELMIGKGDIERARQLMVDAFPQLLENPIELAVDDLKSALVLAATLHANGEIEQRNVLLLAMEQRIATLHRVRGTGYGILDVYIHEMWGDRDQAIAAFREAVDMGWKISQRAVWWMLRDDWLLGSLRQDPEFIALVNELEADINTQRQWYEENKDKPLF